ncbi:MAG: hypothetical protein EA412_14205 [Chitinophagaceae bacterium]|nr:MAG: hypothetical protein EA412_14205 [Chitinophagaceae bacterium]
MNLLFFSRIFSITLCLSLIVSSVFATEKEKPGISLEHIVEGKFIIGGELTSDNIIMSPGYGIRYAPSIKWNERFSVGTAVSLKRLSTETFLPLSAGVRVHLTENANTTFFTAYAGYAFARNHIFDHNLSYSYKGGLYLSPGFGGKLVISENVDFLININLTYQQAKLSFEASESNIIEVNQNFYFVTLRTGFLF